MGERAKLSRDIYCDLSDQQLARKGELVEVVNRNRFTRFPLTVKTDSGMLLNLKESEIEHSNRIRRSKIS